MTTGRLIGSTATAILALVALLTPGGAADAGAEIPCDIVDSDVESGTAMFTVGPAGCAGEVGPVSFSTYDLPGGQILPYEDQVLIGHAEGNGASYGAGTYTLTAPLADALNWQADLYFGESDDQAPHPRMIDVDAQTGITTVTQTTVAQTPQVSSLGATPAQASSGGSLPTTGAQSLPALFIVAATLTTFGFVARRVSRLT